MTPQQRELLNTHFDGLLLLARALYRQHGRGLLTIDEPYDATNKPDYITAPALQDYPNVTTFLETYNPESQIVVSLRDEAGEWVPYLYYRENYDD